MLGNELDRRYILDKIFRVFYIVLIIFIIKIVNMQILNFSYYLKISEKNRIRVIKKIAPRGEIFTSDNKILATNKLSYTLLYFPPDKRNEKNEENLARTVSKVLKINSAQIIKKIDISNYTYKPVKIADNIPVDKMVLLADLKNIFPEIEITEDSVRYYPYGSLLSVLLGYVGKIPQEKIKEYLNMGYDLDATVGRSGVEMRYEKYLRGADGGIKMEVDNRGRLIRIIGSREWERGNDVILTVNYKLQKAAEDALNELSYKRGAALVMDPESGRLLVFAVKPGYDPNFISISESTGTFINEFNIAISGTYPPASTFKIISAAAGLESGKINRNTVFKCEGSLEAKNRVFMCWEKKGHGSINLIDAIAYSCDVYFYNLALKVGPYDIEKMARNFRLGELTGIDLPYEKEGNISAPTSRLKRKSSWFVGDSFNMVIGQGETLVTPIQMLLVISAIASNGYFYRPYFVDKVIDKNGRIVFKEYPKVISMLNLKKETYDVIRESLKEVVKKGTAKWLYTPGIDIYGKTGTAQNPHGKDHAWFIGWAEGKGKKPIAFSVLVEHGEHGSTSAAYVAHKIIKAYFSGENND